MSGRDGKVATQTIITALDGFDPVQLRRVAEHINHRLRGAGLPLPPLTTFRAEAEAWVTFSPRDEKRAYLVQIWRHLPEEDRREFLDQVMMGKRRRTA